MNNQPERQCFLEAEFKKRNIPFVSEEDKIEEDEFAQSWEEEAADYGAASDYGEEASSDFVEEDPVEDADFSKQWEFDIPTAEAEISAKKELSPAEMAAQDEARKYKEDHVPVRSWKYLSPMERRERSDKFAEGYLEYIQTGSIACLSQWGPTPEGYLLSLLDELYLPKTYARIHRTLVYMLGDENDVVQTGHIGALSVIKSDRDSGQVKAFERTKFEGQDIEALRKTILSAPAPLAPDAITPQAVLMRYFGSIYKNKTRDYLRHFNLLKGVAGSEEQDSSGAKKSKYTVYDFRNTEKLEAITTNSEGDDLSDRISALSTGFTADEDFAFGTQQHKLTKAYLTHLLNSKNVPPAPMTVMYARILFQLEKALDPETIEAAIAEYMDGMGLSKDSPDQQRYLFHLYKSSQEAQRCGTDSSLKWGLQRMGRMNIGQLVNDSEQSLHIFFEDSEDICWGSHLWDQLEQPMAEDTPTLWGNVVPTVDIPEKKLSHWATDVHNATVRALMKDIVKDTGLYEYAILDYGFNSQVGAMLRETESKLNSGKKRAPKAPGKEN